MTPETKGGAMTPASLNARGIAFTDSGRYEEALALFDQALAADPSLAGVLYNRAEAKRQLGDLSGARVDLEHALEISPDEADSIHALGLIAYESDDFSGAEERYRRAIELEPRHAAAWNDLGVINFRRGAYRDARICFEKTLEIDPDNAEAWYNIADTYDELGLARERAKALAELKRLGVKPSSEEDRE